MQNVSCIHPKIQTNRCFHRGICPKGADRIPNSVDPGSALFAKACLSKTVRMRKVMKHQFKRRGDGMWGVSLQLLITYCCDILFYGCPCMKKEIMMLHYLKSYGIEPTVHRHTNLNALQILTVHLSNCTSYKRKCSLCISLCTDYRVYDFHLSLFVKKNGLRGFRPGPTQTGLYNNRKCLDA